MIRLISQRRNISKNLFVTPSSSCKFFSVISKYKSHPGIIHDPLQIHLAQLFDALLSKLNVKQSTEGLKGIYIYGPVGCGKTMLMDIFYSECKVKKKRVHFHKFMLDIHQRIHVQKQDLIQKYGRNINLNLSLKHDVADLVAESLAHEFQVLCFDEMQLTDIADAWILSRVMTGLWRRNVLLIATSNRPIDDLYKNGLNREYFLPFIHNLKERTITMHMSSNIDYRMHISTKVYPSFWTPISAETSVLLFSAYLDYARKIRNISAKPVTIPVMMNRTLTVPLGLPGEVCWVDFNTLCKNERGAADYRALCLHFHTIFLDGVPQFSILQHDVARRFITLVDEIYDAQVRLIWTAETDPIDLFLQISEKVISAEIEFGTLATDHTWETEIKPTSDKKQQPMSRAESLLSSSYSVDVNREQKEVQLLHGQLSSVQELHFAFRRAASRLVEISSKQYVYSHAARYLNTSREAESIP